MSKVELAKIRALTFYKDEKTAFRRTSSLSQLVCVGKPCKLYQPEVVRCESLGGSGTDVDWKCEADLPESLRFGKVEVSCEGWSKPGDPYVLKGSCSLEYRLVQVPGSLLRTDNPIFNISSYDWTSIVFYVLWFGFLALILYSFVKSCFRRNNRTARGPRTGSNSQPSSGWFPGSYRDDRDGHNNGPPPPYTKRAESAAPPQGGWQPGFWTGTLFGGLANHLWNRNNNNNNDQNRAAQQSYDWERFRSQPQSSLFGSGFTARPPRRVDDDRGEGSSNLGALRRSTGIGGSTVR